MKEHKEKRGGFYGEYMPQPDSAGEWLGLALMIGAMVAFPLLILWLKSL